MATPEARQRKHIDVARVRRDASAAVARSVVRHVGDAQHPATLRGLFDRLKQEQFAAKTRAALKTRLSGS